MPLSPTLPTLKAAVAVEVRKAMNPGSPVDVATVHTYRRFWRDPDKFRKLFERKAPDLLPGKLNGWMIYRPSTNEIEAEERWRFYSLHRLEIVGFMGIQDEDVTTNEQAFENQIEVVRDNIRLNRSIFGNMEKVVPSVQVDDVGPVLVGDSTFWRAQLSLITEAIEVKTETP